MLFHFTLICRGSWEEVWNPFYTLMRNGEKTPRDVINSYVRAGLTKEWAMKRLLDSWATFGAKLKTQVAVSLPIRSCATYQRTKRNFSCSFYEAKLYKTVLLICDKEIIKWEQKKNSWKFHLVFFMLVRLVLPMSLAIGQFKCYLHCIYRSLFTWMRWGVNTIRLWENKEKIAR